MAPAHTTLACSMTHCHLHARRPAERQRVQKHVVARWQAAASGSPRRRRWLSRPSCCLHAAAVASSGRHPCWQPDDARHRQSRFALCDGRRLRKRLRQHSDTLMGFEKYTHWPARLSPLAEVVTCVSQALRRVHATCRCALSCKCLCDLVRDLITN